jgi:chromate transporter
MRENLLGSLILSMIGFSLTSLGGGPSVFGPLQHEAVDVQHWVSAFEFVNIFAISRAAPGPGTMLVTLVGWKVDGWLGATLATLAFFLPSSLLCYGTIRIWNRYKGQDWHVALENGLAPVGVGLILVGIPSIGRIAGNTLLFWVVAGVTSVLLIRYNRIHPILLLFGGALVFIAAWALQIG